MRKLVYYAAVSLDGFIAAPDGAADFFPVNLDLMAAMNERHPETVPTAYREAAGLQDAPNKRFDTVLMGRATYEMGLNSGTDSPWSHLRQFVVSTTLAAAGPGVELSDHALPLVRRLKAQDGGDIWISGGGVLAASLLPEIDELILKRYPVVTGAGIPLFNGGFNPHTFDRVTVGHFGAGTTVTTYTQG
ncbi:dihydrofolate reductase family protein [Nonomuraea sp. SYSU D8015]|uniref:dihydrofolate reductase family protein n=1 Tax=Nonomuraea sp. SYSU D8015 TaxID=2593644 RepID=UPI001660838F|nr:dihydrofolate reductase family protein [Nonomuraea sp. SYSU D8015]